MMMENEGLITQEDIDMISKNSAAGDFEKKEEMKSLSGGAAAGGAAGPQEEEQQELPQNNVRKDKRYCRECTAIPFKSC